ncbi:MAG: trypsin-like peptidase domain-containing protein [Candidatus Hydrogenedentes bacterium]|nr:trypsin-like peptidase domain-containing protein [Candidatus Hydrogenedentota bacterium]
MKYVSVLAVVCGIVCSGCVTMGGEHAVLRAKNKVAPALVHVRPVKEIFTGGKREEMSVVGSGFIISPDGYVVTNEHVAGEATLVRCVLFNKEEVEAKVVGTDKLTDLAVLKLETDHKSLPYVKLGSSSRLQTGETVLALGSPHGLARSVSKGIVSVTDRYLGDHDDMVSPYNTWIQTDAAINPGNSGGPLVNLKGVVVGVNARRLGGADNVGFAIPIDAAKEVIEAIIKNGRVQRSWIGVTLQEVTSKTDDPKQLGVVIADVDPLSPAAEAGLRPGDVLLSINGKATDARYVEALPAVRKMIADLPIDEKVSAKVQRGTESIDIPITPIEKSDVRGEEVEFAEWGFTASDVTPSIARAAQLPSTQGMFISGCQVGGVVANAGLRQGDIVLKVDGKDLASMTAFKELYKERIESKQALVLFEVKSGALTRFVLVKQMEGGGTPNPEDNEDDGGSSDEG